MHFSLETLIFSRWRNRLLSLLRKGGSFLTRPLEMVHNQTNSPFAQMGVGGNSTTAIAPDATEETQLDIPNDYWAREPSIGNKTS